MRFLEDSCSRARTLTSGTFRCEWLCVSKWADLYTSTCTLAQNCFNTTGSVHHAQRLYISFLQSEQRFTSLPLMAQGLIWADLHEIWINQMPPVFPNWVRQLHFISILASLIPCTVCGGVVLVSLTEHIRTLQTGKYPRAWLWCIAEKANVLAPVQVCATNDYHYRTDE